MTLHLDLHHCDSVTVLVQHRLGWEQAQVWLNYGTSNSLVNVKKKSGAEVVRETTASLKWGGSKSVTICKNILIDSQKIIFLLLFPRDREELLALQKDIERRRLLKWIIHGKRYKWTIHFYNSKRYFIKSLVLPEYFRPDLTCLHTADLKGDGLQYGQSKKSAVTCP